MKLVLVNQRYGHSRTIVIKGWLKGLLSLCLLGAPVALGLGYQLALADENTRLVVSHEQGVQDVASPASAKTPLNWIDSAGIPDSSSSSAVNFTESVDVADSWRGAWPGSWYSPWQIDLLTDRLVVMMGQGAVEIMHPLPMPDWQYDAVASPAAVVSHTLAWVAQLGETHSFEPHQGTFAHGRIIDPASYLRRTHR